jgi:hypothetical protein
MPGSIPAPNFGSFMEKNKKNIGSQMGQSNKKTSIFEKRKFLRNFDLCPSICMKLIVAYGPL